MLYRILKFIVGIGIRIYYKEIRMIGRENLPEKGPLLIIANHPNTLMDAWVVGFVCRQPIYFMAKSAFFSSGFRLKILRKLNMIPINRAGEGKAKGVSNDQSFEECYQLLEAGKTIVIFPEGTSYQERILRKLKTGAARIALEAEKRNGGKLGVKIVPLGLNYSRPERFRSSVLVAADKPIVAAEYLEDYTSDFIATSRSLTALFRERMERVLVTTEDKLHDYLLEEVRNILTSKYLKSEKDEFELLKKIRDGLYGVSIYNPERMLEIRQLVEEIKWQTDHLALKADFLDRRFRSVMFLRQLLFSFFGLVIMAPVFAYGVIHNGIQFKLTDKVIPLITKEVEYYAPLAVLIGFIMYPLFYLGYIAIWNHFFLFPWWAKLIYFVSLPVSGILAYSIHKYYRHVTLKLRFTILMRDRKDMVQDLREQKKRLRYLIGM